MGNFLREKLGQIRACVVQTLKKEADDLSVCADPTRYGWKFAAGPEEKDVCQFLLWPADFSGSELRICGF